MCFKPERALALEQVDFKCNFKKNTATVGKKKGKKKCLSKNCQLLKNEYWVYPLSCQYNKLKQSEEQQKLSTPLFSIHWKCKVLISCHVHLQFC